MTAENMRYGLIVHLIPDQRRMFQDARKSARYEVRGVSAATIASIETLKRAAGGTTGARLPSSLRRWASNPKPSRKRDFPGWPSQ
jgi:hypothetical protein